MGIPRMAVVKANVYGRGLGPVTLTALPAGVSWLRVTQLTEVLTLHALLDKAGVSRPVGEPTSQTPRLLTWFLLATEPD